MELVFGLRISSYILKHAMFRQLDQFPSSGEMVEASILLGSLEESSSQSLFQFILTDPTK
jgi:hypothetical protein